MNHQKLTALMLAAAVLSGASVTASAATKKNTSTSAPDKLYSVSVEGEQLVFSLNGQRLTPYELREAALRVQLDKEGDLLLSFTDADGKNRSLALGRQRTLNIAGEMDSLTLDKTLEGQMDVTLEADSEVGVMTVASRGDIIIEGDVASLLVTGGAKVLVTGSANVTRAKLTDVTARLTAEDGADVRHVIATDSDRVSGSGIGSTTETGGPDDDGKWSVKIEMEDNDEHMYYSVTRRDGLVELRDIDADEIRNYVKIIGTDEDGDKHYLNGEFSWKDPHKVLFDPDNPRSQTFTCQFTFDPSKSDYGTENGRIKIDVVYR